MRFHAVPTLDTFAFNHVRFAAPAPDEAGEKRPVTVGNLFGR